MKNLKIALGILIPLIGTTLGSSLVFLMKEKKSNKIEIFLIGFAAGVMLAASIWSLIIPSIEMAEENGIIPWLPASVGFILGIIFFIVIDKILDEIKKTSKKTNDKTMLLLAVTLHNIPEGMAVGAIFAGIILGNSMVTITSALALSIGIAIQNFPEGAIISMPLKNLGFSKLKSFTYGFLSGVVEPLGAFITILLTHFIIKILPGLLSFAAGAMIYVIVEELVPECQSNKSSKIGTLGISFGFIIMMILDVVFS